MTSITSPNREFPPIVTNETIEVEDTGLTSAVEEPSSQPGPGNRNNHNDTDALSATSSDSINSDEASFVILPALEPSQSVVRRRAKRHLLREQRWRKRYGKRNDEGLKRKSEPVDLDDADDEEAMGRRSSNHGSFGILPHSSALLSASCGGACRSYRRDRLIQEIDDANRTGKHGQAAVLKTLRDAGIMVYIIDSKVCISLEEIVASIRKVIAHVCSDKESLAHPSDEKCLLYRDVEGRLFNLTLASSYVSLASTWESLLHSFSVLQATLLLAVLQRSFPCAVLDGESEQVFQPAYLALVIGLVFSEEIALSWANVALLVRGLPSISAYALVTNVDSDWLKKILLFLLAFAPSAPSTLVKACTFAGLALACCILLANLGSRSWKYLHWRPTMSGTFCLKNGSFAPMFAFIAAILTGLCFPYLGHRQIEAGGTAAMESVLRIAIVVAGLFILSDYDEIQKYLVVGADNCNQDYVNLAVGAWWGLSLIASLTVLFCRGRGKENNSGPICVWPKDEEPLLEEDHASPVRYKVPHLPDFPVDPSLISKGWIVDCCCSVGMEYVLGLAVAIGIGWFICYLGTTTLDYNQLADVF